MQFFRQLDRFLAVARFTDYLHVRLVFQHAAEPTPNQAVIIHEQDCDLLFHRTPLFLWVRQDAPGCRPRRAAKTRSGRPSIRNVRASPPDRSLASWAVR